MGRAHRRNTPQTAAKRAREQDYRDRRRRAALEREIYRELAEHLVIRAAAAGDESALRILTWREHLQAVGLERTEDVTAELWHAVETTHAGRTPRAFRAAGMSPMVAPRVQG